LYDIANDPGETRDVASGHPGLCAELQREINERMAAMPVVKEHHTIPVGYPEWPVTHLETQDAITSGSIQRSSVHPNCSWICGWTDLKDDLTWQIEVETAGTYLLTVLYSAHAGMLGSRFEAACEGSACVFDIVEEFNAPELRGMDRYPREESYEKAFAPMVAGNLTLPKGPARFILRGLLKPGEEMPHLRGVKLTLVPTACP
jgi:hypothetical protein